jgi:branched-chain amino acid transport system permease protein
MFLQLIINGISVGSLYALIALAMVIIYKTSRVLNFAQGEMAMISTFIAFNILDNVAYNYTVAFTGALLFAILLGMVLEFVFLRRAKDPNILNLIIITLGLEMILYGFASWKWGAEQKYFHFPISDREVVSIFSVIVSHLNISTIVVAIVLMLGLFAFFKYSKLGIAMKATQQNMLAARINGIRTNRINSITWGLSSFIGAIAGIMFAPTTTLDPNLMWDPLLKGFAAAVLGGMTTLVGPILGGYILGIIENIFGAYVSLEFKSVVAFLIIVIILCFKPSGLFAKHYIRKV